MKSFKTFITKNWHIIIPVLPALFITGPFVAYLVKVHVAGYPVSEAAAGIFSEGLVMELVKYIFWVFGQAAVFGIISLAMFLLGLKISKPLLIPVMVMGLAGVYAGYIPFLIEFYLPYYLPDPPTGGAQAGLAFLALPFILVPFYAGGVATGLLVSLCIALIINLRPDTGTYAMKRERKKWWIATAVVVASLYIFILVPLGIKGIGSYTLSLEARSVFTDRERLAEIYRKAEDLDNSKLLSYLAKNRNTAPDILEKLANEESFSIRRAVALNPNTPPATLVVLSDDQAPAVRRNVCLNDSVPEEVVVKLCNDSVIIVRSTAERTLQRMDPFRHLRQHEGNSGIQ